MYNTKYGDTGFYSKKKTDSAHLYTVCSMRYLSKQPNFCIPHFNINLWYTLYRPSRTRLISCLHKKIYLKKSRMGLNIYLYQSNECLNAFCGGSIKKTFNCYISFCYISFYKTNVRGELLKMLFF